MASNKTMLGIKIYALTLVALFITGTVFRLCGVWSVSWWLITLPLWGGLAVVLVTLGFFALCFLIVSASAESCKSNRRTSRKIIIEPSTPPEPPIRGELKN